MSEVRHVRTHAQGDVHGRVQAKRRARGMRNGAASLLSPGARADPLSARGLPCLTEKDALAPAEWQRKLAREPAAFAAAYRVSRVVLERSAHGYPNTGTSNFICKPEKAKRAWAIGYEPGTALI